ncbi:MAG: glutathione S-transferase family protein [Pseudolabrys sp.]
MYTIYGVPFSIHTRKVIVTALHKQLKFTVEPVIPFNPPAGWDDLSPTGKIPVLSDGYMSIADSTVICMFLDRANAERPVYPSDTGDFIKALWLEEYCDGTLFANVLHKLLFQKFVRPKILGEQPDPTAVAEIIDKAVPETFGYLEKNLTNDYLVGDRLSIADIALVSNLLNFYYIGHTIDRTRYPRLAAYFARRLDEPAFAEAIAAEKPVVEQVGLSREFLGKLAA